MTSHDWGKLILRLGLSAVFLWFGFSQLLDGINWVSWVPAWAPAFFHLPPAMIILAHGTFEVVFGGLLAMGLFTRAVTLLLALQVFFITIEIGLTPIGLRDFGLGMATLALFFLEDGLGLFRRSTY